MVTFSPIYRRAAAGSVVSGGGNGTDAGAVHYTGDSPTSGQQAQAQANLGLGSAATHAATDFEPAGAAAAAQSAAQGSSLQKASNLSDLPNAVAARTALGLGSAATQPTTAFDAAGVATTARNAAVGAAFLLGS